MNTDSKDTVANSRSKWLIPTIIGLSFLFLIGKQLVDANLHKLWITGNQAVYLMAGDLILDGKIPYQDFFDFNPPLIMYVNTVPVLLARIFHLPAPYAFALLLLVIHALVIGWCGSMLMRKPACLPVIVFLPFLWVFAFLTNTLDGNLGEREHIFLVLFLPLFIYRGLRYSGERFSDLEAASIGALAAIGLFLKPHFLFIALCAELGFVIEHKDKLSRKIFFSMEVISILGFMVLYAVAFLCLPIQAQKIFFEQCVPLYYSGSGFTVLSFGDMVFRSNRPFVHFLLALTIALALRGFSKWIVPLSYLCLSAMCVYLIGAQSWVYRQIPLAWFSDLLLALEAGVLVQIVLLSLRERTKDWALLRTAPLSIASVLCAISLVHFVYYTIVQCYQFENSPRFTFYDGSSSIDCARSDFYDTFHSIVQLSKPTDSVVWLGFDLLPGCPAMLQSNRRSGSRYLYSVLENVEYAIENSDSPKQEFFRELEDQVVTNLGADIRANRPHIVFIGDRSMRILNRHGFVAKYMSDYSKIGYVEGSSIFESKGSKKSTGSLSSER